MIETIIVFALIPVVALLANAMEDHSDSISFDPAYNKAGLPIITLSNDGKDFHFLVDTGANLCVLNNSVVNEIKHRPLEGKGTMFGMEGNIQTVEYVEVELNHGEDIFKVEFQVLNLDAAFGRIEAQHDVTVHGVLGVDFLKNNKGKVDFIDNKLIYGREKNKTALKGQNE